MFILKVEVLGFIFVILERVREKKRCVYIMLIIGIKIVMIGSYREEVFLDLRLGFWDF